jgi:N-acetylmuramoyl-L-alanine amidase
MNRLLGVLIIFVLTTGMIVVYSTNSMARDAKGGFVVVIDPAHGGDEMGVKIKEDIYEKDITLTLAKQIQKHLEGTGKVKVELTRTSDRSVSISERVKKAASSRADLFISIHMNAGFGKKASGFEVYFTGFRGPSTEGSGSHEIVKDMVRTQYLNEGVRYARLLLKHMESVFPRKDRGLREAPIRIIQELTIPAVVLETGFATETTDRKELLEPSKQKAVADAIGKSVLEYL